MLEIYLSKRPLDPDLNLDDLATRLEGFSGADIKYICDRAATIPFLKSVATGQEGDIDQQILDDVIADTQKSVNREMLKRFDDWAGQAVS
jgi:SpoVK/Ycf46/Vps4 family AAA+-type ATPase